MAHWDGERWLDMEVSEPRTTSRARRVFDHSWKALLEGALVALMIVGLTVGAAFAAKGGGAASGGGKHGGGTTAGTGTLSGPVLLNSSDGVAQCGQSISFRVTSTSKYYFVRATCDQGGARVWEQ